MRTTVLGLALGCGFAAATIVSASACQFHQTTATADPSAPAQVAQTDAPAPPAAPVVEPTAPTGRSDQTQSE
jgi:hypothetical protein